MLPSKYSISSSNTDRSISSNHHHRQQQQQQHVSSMSSQQQSQIPLGITGVVCTSQMIDLPNQRGKIHCTIYRPRMLQQQPQPQQQNVVIQKSSSRSNTSTSNSNKFKLKIPKVPQPNPPLICVCGGPNMSCQYLTGLVHIITDRAIIIYDHLHCGQSTGSSRSHNTTTTNNQMTSVENDHVNDDNDNNNDDTNPTNNNSNYNCTFLNNTMNDLRIVIQTLIPNNTKYHLFGHSMGGIIVYEYIKQEILMAYNNNNNNKLQQDTTVTSSNNNEHYKSYCLSCILASTPINIQKSIQSKHELIQNIINELKQTGYDRTNIIKQHDDDNDDDDDSDDDDENDINEQQQLLYAAQIEFQKRHECRVDPIPLSLQQSLTGLYRSTSNNNSNQIRQKPKITTILSYQQQYQYPSLNNYIAKPITIGQRDNGDIDIVKDGTTTMNEININLPPALIIRGQYDFILETNCRDWENIFQNEPNYTNHIGHNNNNDNKNNMKHCQYITISNCSHYGFLEQENLYGNVIMSFLHDHDNDTI